MDDGINRGLIAPLYLDIHSINDTHRHIGMMYVATSASADITLAPDEHNAIRWFTLGDMDDPTYELTDGMKFYMKEALKMARIAN